MFLAGMVKTIEQSGVREGSPMEGVVWYRLVRISRKVPFGFRKLIIDMTFLQYKMGTFLFTSILSYSSITHAINQSKWSGVAPYSATPDILF